MCIISAMASTAEYDKRRQIPGCLSCRLLTDFSIGALFGGG
jgi:hypothetical protein